MGGHVVGVRGKGESLQRGNLKENAEAAYQTYWFPSIILRHRLIAIFCLTTGDFCEWRRAFIKLILFAVGDVACCIDPDHEQDFLFLQAAGELFYLQLHVCIFDR